MEREIETKCLHLEEDEGKQIILVRSVTLFIRQRRMHIRE